jgi:predicted enzyme related to lactoylglutathione lyase
MWKNIEYFSVAVKNLEEGMKLYEGMFGLKPEGPVKNDTRMGFRSVVLGNGQRHFVEIIEPAEPDSALARFMKARARPDNPDGEGLYLVGVEIDDIEKEVKNIRSRGGKVTQQADEPGIAWVHPMSARHTFIELRQQKPQK